MADLPDAARSEVERLMGHPLKNDDVPTASSQRALWKSAVKIPLAADGIVELEAIARTASKNWRPPPR